MQRNDILKLLFETPYEALRERADEVRAREKGEHVFVRGLIEFSNRCERNCRYCGLRSANPSLKRYRLDEAQIVEAAERPWLSAWTLSSCNPARSTAIRNVSPMWWMLSAHGSPWPLL